MIITRSPFRVSLGGGGTDLPSYYSSYEGFLISAAINKYVYIMLNRRFEDGIRVSYSRTEIVDRVDELQHPIVREALKMLKLGPKLEIVSIADLPTNTGLGSSSSFTVGLLHALHVLKRDPVSAQQLAEEAFHLEAEILGEPIGRQDQYAAAYGGIICLEIDRQGRVAVNPLALHDHVTEELQSNVTLWYTGIRRPASEVLEEQNQSFQEHQSNALQAMHTIKAIGYEIRAALIAGKPYRFGELLDMHWQTKKGLSDKVSSSEVDRWYETARNNGALGGKIIGAGGGGFFMFYCHNSDKNRLRQAMIAEGLRELRFAIDAEGSKVLANFE